MKIKRNSCWPSQFLQSPCGTSKVQTICSLWYGSVVMCTGQRILISQFVFLYIYDVDEDRYNLWLWLLRSEIMYLVLQLSQRYPLKAKVLLWTDFLLCVTDSLLSVQARRQKFIKDRLACEGTYRFIFSALSKFGLSVDFVPHQLHWNRRRSLLPAWTGGTIVATTNVKKGKSILKGPSTARTITITMTGNILFQNLFRH